MGKDRINISYKAYFLRFAMAIMFAVSVFSALDFLILNFWNSSDSTIVSIVDVGAETELSTDDDDDGAPFKTVQNELVVEVLTGEKKGQISKILVTQMDGSGMEFHRDARYVLISDVFDDGTMQYSISDTFRIPSVLGFIVFIAGSIVAFAGRSGIKALLGLGLSIACLICGFVPMISKGYPPVPLAFASVIFISSVTIMCVVNRKQSRMTALMGALGGVFGAFLLSVIMVKTWQLSGMAEESASLLVSTLPGIDMRGILLSSIIISAIGAVLDVAISISATMSEMIEYDPHIPLGRLWTSGIRVGEEVLGSMINTLILAYIGVSLPVAVLINNAGVNFMGLMNDPYIGQEIVQSLAGTSGLLLTIPITATLFVVNEKMLKRRKKIKERS